MSSELSGGRSSGEVENGDMTGRRIADVRIVDAMQHVCDSASAGAAKGQLTEHLTLHQESCRSCNESRKETRSPEPCRKGDCSSDSFRQLLSQTRHGYPLDVIPLARVEM